MSHKVVTGKVRASYVHVFTPQSFEDGPSKYSCSLLISKDDQKTIDEVKKGIELATKDGLPKWGGRIPPNFSSPLRDGDTERPEDPAYAHCYFINATSVEAPGVVDRKRVRITDPKMIYSGCYIRAVINFYPFSVKGNRGVAAGLANIQFVADGEPLNGRSRAEDDFDNLDDDDFDDFLS